MSLCFIGNTCILWKAAILVNLTETDELTTITFIINFNSCADRYVTKVLVINPLQQSNKKVLHVFYLSFVSKSFCQSVHRIFYSVYPPLPRKQSWGGGYIGITLSVCLFVRLFTSCPCYNFVSTCLDNIWNNGCPWPKGSSWSWPKVIFPRLRSQCTQTKNPCLCHKSSPPSRIWIIFHTIVVHEPRVCHYLDPRSYLQGQGHRVHIPKICVQAITPHCLVGSG